MIDNHDKQALWEIKYYVAGENLTTTVQGTYFEAFQKAIKLNKKKSVTLTTVKELTKTYSAALKASGNGTVKSLKLADNIAKLKAMSPDENIISVSPSTFYTLNDFYQCRLVKSALDSISETSEIYYLGEIKKEITEQYKKINSFINNFPETISKKTTETVFTAAMLILGCIVLMYALIITKVIASGGITNSKYYEACYKEKKNLTNCYQYADIIESFIYGQPGIDLEKHTEKFNNEIYANIETCSTKNLPDIRNTFEKIAGKRSLLSFCQSEEILKIRSEFYSKERQR